MANLKVLKFGGTSLRTKVERTYVLNIIKQEVKTNKIVIIVSAMGRYPEPYATDTLLEMGKNLTKKEQDEILSCGEIISSHLLTNEAILEGLNCHCINIIENGIFMDKNNEVIFVDSDYIYQLLKQYDIIIVPGFFGTNHKKYIVSLKRGGSDFSALLIAHSLGLKEVTIYSDVCGIYSADPKFIKNPILYEHVNIDQAVQLSSLNVKVIQQNACEFAKNKNIKIILKSTFQKDESTIVEKDAPMHDFLIFQEKEYLILNHNGELSYYSKNKDPQRIHDEEIVQKMKENTD